MKKKTLPLVFALAFALGFALAPASAEAQGKPAFFQALCKYDLHGGLFTLHKVNGATGGEAVLACLADGGQPVRVTPVREASHPGK